MNQQLIDDIWLKVMREAPINKIPELFAALVAEECAKLCDEDARQYGTRGDYGTGRHAPMAQACGGLARTIRAKFPLPKEGV